MILLVEHLWDIIFISFGELVALHVAAPHEPRIFYTFLPVLREYTTVLLASWFRESVWMTLGDKLLRRFLLLLSIFVFLVSVFSQIPPVWTTQAVADQSSMTVYTGQYLKQLQGASNDRLDNATWRAACTAGVALRRPMRRGCSGGSRKQRHTQ